MQSGHATAAAALPTAFPARWARLSLADLSISLLFAAIVVIQIANHEMWRDEIHSWGLVLASSSLADLFANLRYTGHPGLWYLLLWCASWFTESPFTVQIVHAAISVLLIAAIGLWSPFSRLEKLLLLCSYFVLFEYTVVSRNYGIGMLLALIYAQCRGARPDRLYLNGFLLGLLANTSLFGLVLSAAFACELALDMLLKRKWRFRTLIGPLARGAAFYVPLAALAAVTIWPAADISWRSTGEPFRNPWNLTQLAVVASHNVASMLPIHALDYWVKGPPSAAALTGPSRLNAPVLLLSALPALFAAYYLIFTDKRRLLIIPALTLAGSIAVGHLVYSGSIRHWGVNFVAFVAALWMQRLWSSARSAAATALLAVSALAGVAVSVQQAPLTFSEAEATARWISDNGLANDALVATPDTMVAPVAVYLGKPAYYLDCSCTADYMFYHNRRDPFDESQIPARLARAVDELRSKPILFITSDRLSDPQRAEIRQHGIGATTLAEFTNASTDENYYVYRVEKAAAGAPR